MAGVKGRSGRRPTAYSSQKVTAALAQLTSKAMAVIEESLKHKDPNIRVASAWRIIEHVKGRPAQSIVGKDGGPILGTFTLNLGDVRRRRDDDHDDGD